MVRGRREFNGFAGKQPPAGRDFQARFPVSRRNLINDP
jgi:hypothetical protein